MSFYDGNSFADETDDAPPSAPTAFALATQPHSAFSFDHKPTPPPPAHTAAHARPRGGGFAEDEASFHSSEYDDEEGGYSDESDGKGSNDNGDDDYDEEEDDDYEDDEGDEEENEDDEEEDEEDDEEDDVAGSRGDSQSGTLEDEYDDGDGGDEEEQEGEEQDGSVHSHNQDGDDNGSNAENISDNNDDDDEQDNNSHDDDDDRDDDEEHDEESYNEDGQEDEEAYDDEAGEEQENDATQDARRVDDHTAHSPVKVGAFGLASSNTPAESAFKAFSSPFSASTGSPFGSTSSAAAPAASGGFKSFFGTSEAPKTVGPASFTQSTQPMAQLSPLPSIATLNEPAAMTKAPTTTTTAPAPPPAPPQPCAPVNHDASETGSAPRFEAILWRPATSAGARPTQKRFRNEVEEDAAVTALLAHFKAAIPTRRFDAQIKTILDSI